MKFRALEWSKGKADVGGTYLVSAPSPAGWNHYLTIGFQDGEFFPLWDNAYPGSTSLVEMQALGQAVHEAKLAEQFERWIEVD